MQQTKSISVEGKHCNSFHRSLVKGLHNESASCFCFCCLSFFSQLPEGRRFNSRKSSSRGRRKDLLNMHKKTSHNSAWAEDKGLLSLYT